jgi:hypothetical protein
MLSGVPRAVPIGLSLRQTCSGLGNEPSGKVNFLHEQREHVALLSTVLIIVFALACLGTFLCVARKEWKGSRLISAIIAVVSFLLALLLAHK